MKAGMLFGTRQIEVRDTETPSLGDREVLIEPLRAGICGSDLSLYTGHRQPPSFPYIIGHEVVARVRAVAPGVTRVAVGDRVIIEPNYTCGSCVFCRSGRGNICPNKRSTGVTVPGVFAHLAAVPEEFTWAVPEAMSDADAATIEPLAVSVHALKQSGARPGDTVAVLGCGVIGLLLVHVAVARGVRVIAHDRLPEKQQMAAALGATIADTDDVAGLWKAQDVRTVFECAGVTATTELAIGSAPRGATVMILGLSTSPASFVPLKLVREGVRIEPSLIYDHPTDFIETIKLVGDGTLVPSRIITDTFAFDDIARAMDTAAGGSAGKVHMVFA